MASDPDSSAIHAVLAQFVEQSVEHAFLLIAPDGTIQWCNAAAQSMFAAPAASMAGQSFDTLFTPEDRAAGIPQLEISVATQTRSSIDDRWHLRRDGTTFWSSGVLSRIDQPGTSQLLGFGKIIRDRTDAKTHVELLTNQRAQSDADNAAKDRAITNLVHELRNVIGGIRGSVELLDRPLDNAAVRAKFSTLMQHQLGMIERLVEDLLDVKRAKSGAIVLSCESLVLQEELRMCIERLQPRLRSKGHALELLVPPGEIIVTADRVRLQQMFGNLLDNAIKYTPQDGRIWVTATTEDRSAVVHFKDTGRGIPHDMLKSIFELFTQVDPSSSGGGLGVGLALVRELTLLHGGSVQASSQGVGQGSEFSVRMPLVAVRAAE